MSRRKKKKHHQQIRGATREQQLKDRCASLGWQLPFHLRNWRNHFISQSSYMLEFERWMAEKCRMGGSYVKVIVEIEDDYWPTNNTPDEYEESWIDYWSQGEWGGQAQQVGKYSGFYNKWARSLPMDHKIAAPFGDVGASLVCI